MPVSRSAGALVGCLAALGAGRMLSGLRDQVTPADPPTLGAAPTLLTLTALLASRLPARRASSVDPLRALVDE